MGTTLGSFGGKYAWVADLFDTLTTIERRDCLIAFGIMLDSAALCVDSLAIPLASRIKRAISEAIEAIKAGDKRPGKKKSIFNERIKVPRTESFVPPTIDGDGTAIPEGTVFNNMTLTTCNRGKVTGFWRGYYTAISCGYYAGLARMFLTELAEESKPEGEPLLREIIALVEPAIEQVFSLLPGLEKRLLEELHGKAKKTFALPSHSVMFTLLALFAGKPDRIPRKLFSKPVSQRTEEEKAEAEALLNSIIQTKTTNRVDENTLEPIEEKTVHALICDHPKVKAEAHVIQGKLFWDRDRVTEEALALHIKKTFGAEGMKHLMGLLIGLEEEGRTGSITIELNEHLARLGYKRKSNGSFDPELKRTATDIIRIFTGLVITTRNKDGKREDIEAKRLFVETGIGVSKLNNEILSETIELQATPFWYQTAFETEGKTGAQFTKLLHNIATENAHEHPLTLFLAPLLAICWRMNPEGRAFSIENLMDWCSMDYSTNNPHRDRDLKRLGAELGYMAEKGYLGSWVTEDSIAGKIPNQPPADTIEPFKATLHLYPPAWLKEEIDVIKDRQRRHLAERTARKRDKPLTIEQVKAILEKSGLSQNSFGNHLGVSHQAVSNMMRRGRVSPEMSAKILEKFGSLLGNPPG